jgi:hypothetical protein
MTMCLLLVAPLGVVAEINADSPDFGNLAPMVDAAQQELAEHKEASQAALAWHSVHSSSSSRRAAPSASR